MFFIALIKFKKKAKDVVEIGFEPDRALVNYNVKDGDIWVLKEA